MPEFITTLIDTVSADPLGSARIILIAYGALLWLSIMIWVTRDALSRSESIMFQAFSILLSIGVPILGVILYLIIRPSKTLSDRYYEMLEAKVLEEESKEGMLQGTQDGHQSHCDKCLIPVKDDYAYCPNCSIKLKKSCDSCKKTFPNIWSLCPFCGTKYKEKKKIAKPAKKSTKTKKPTDSSK